MKRSRMATASARDFTTARRRFATRCCRPRRSPRMRTPRSRAHVELLQVCPEWRAIGSTPTRSGARRAVSDAYVGAESSTRGRTHVSAGRQRRGTTTTRSISVKMVIWSIAKRPRTPIRRPDARPKRRALAYIGYQKDGAIHRDAVEPISPRTPSTSPGRTRTLLCSTRWWHNSRRGKTASASRRIPLGGVLGGRPSGFDEGARAVARSTTATGRARRCCRFYAQLSAPETRDAAWTWMKAHWDALFARVSTLDFGGLRLLGDRRFPFQRRATTPPTSRPSSKTASARSRRGAARPREWARGHPPVRGVSRRERGERARALLSRRGGRRALTPRVHVRPA